ncbi:TonB-dependent receptor domain-containing protein [candidate division CSSED10-310 bacterium]|uniref:TonB-dependent receptor domain-containing protein n=1 Tax=candidate division CSSED10-310 bacterium TaxID=2855610 RepID=A0ABV6YU90_UNCC1
MPDVLALETTGSLSGIIHSSSEEVPAPLINNPLLQSTYLTIIAGANTQPLAGATISVESPRLMGTRVGTTDEKGHFRLLYLPPGHYTVTVNFPGFSTVIRSSVIVSLGKDTSLQFTLKPSELSESIEVTAVSPAIDENTTATGGNMTEQEFSRLPMKRTYQDVAAFFAGVDNSLGDHDLTMVGSPSMLDGTGAENNYLIDGFTTTDPYDGTSGTNLLFNFIEEVEIKTGGYEAEYGRATGGIINVITKSGGNDFSGNLVSFINTYEMNGSGKYRQYRGRRSEWMGNQEFDAGLDLGGYLVKDTFWFFLAYNPSFKENKWSVEQEIRKGELTTHHYAAKLTWSIVPLHRLVFSLFGDPSQYEGCDLSYLNDSLYVGADAKFTAAADKSAYQRIIKRGSQNYVLNYTGIVNDTFVVEASLGYRYQRDSTEPASAEGYAAQHIFHWDNPEKHGFADNPEYRDGYIAGGIGFFHDYKIYRKMFDVRGTYYRTSHTVKAGANYEQNTLDYTGEISGGQTIVYFTKDRFDDYAITKFSDHGVLRTINTAFFVQDNWQVTDFLTLNVGLRYETQDLKAHDGSRAFSINDNLAPRLGFSWDVKNNNKSKVFGSYGRFYESIPLQLNTYRFNWDFFETEFWRYGADKIPFTEDDKYNYTSVNTPKVRVSSDLKGQCLDEYLLGCEAEVLPDLALGALLRYRTIIRIIEDRLSKQFTEMHMGVTSKDYRRFHELLICNPGEGQVSDQPEPKREYTALELTAHKNFSDHYQFNLAYIWSTLRGNYDGLYDPYAAEVDAHSSQMFNSELYLRHSEGYLYQDIRHRFKLHGAYAFDCGLTMGSLVKIQSGRPISTLGHMGLEGWVFAEERGAQGRTPWLWQWDLHLEYAFRFWKYVDTTVMLDVFNVTNNNEVMSVQNFKYSGLDGSYYHIDTQSFVNPSPYWKEPLTYQIPRLIRFGVRFSF